MKAFKAFIKPFEAPQKKYNLFFSLRPGITYFFLFVRDWDGKGYSSFNFHSFKIWLAKFWSRYVKSDLPLIISSMLKRFQG